VYLLEAKFLKKSCKIGVDYVVYAYVALVVSCHVVVVVIAQWHRLDVLRHALSTG
jgi:hypothetical protein